MVSYWIESIEDLVLWTWQLGTGAAIVVYALLFVFSCALAAGYFVILYFRDTTQQYSWWMVAYHVGYLTVLVAATCVATSYVIVDFGADWGLWPIDTLSSGVQQRPTWGFRRSIPTSMPVFSFAFAIIAFFVGRSLLHTLWGIATRRRTD